MPRPPSSTGSCHSGFVIQSNDRRSNWCTIPGSSSRRWPPIIAWFALAGLLKLLVRREWVQDWLASRTERCCKACLLGMPTAVLAVIPVTASLPSSSASRCHTSSSVQPSNGIDSILATYALMGNAFTLVRLIVAFISGLICGLLVDLLCRPTSKSQGIALSAIPLTPLQQSILSVLAQIRPFTCTAHSRPANKRSLGQAMRYGLITLPADLAKALSIGLLLAGQYTSCRKLDERQLEQWPTRLSTRHHHQPATLCVGASIPMAYALLLPGSPRGCPDLPYHGPRVPRRSWPCGKCLDVRQH